LRARRALSPSSTAVVASATLLALVAGCGPEDLQLPATPDLDMLVQAYDMPTGTIDPQHLDQIMADAKARLQQLQLEWLPDLVASFLTILRQQADDHGLSTDPNGHPDMDRPKIEAVIRVLRNCSGWSDMPASETPAPGTPPNGTLDGTAVISDSELRRTMTINGTSCRAQVEATNRIARSLLPTLDVFLNGTLNVFFYDRLPRTVAETKVLVQISGELGTAQMTVSGTFDFRLFYPNVDFRLPRPDGDIIVSVTPDGITLHGSNATYSCDVALQSCGPV